MNSYTSGAQSLPKVAMDYAGDFVVTWESNGEDGGGLAVYAQRYSATGTTLGTEFQVNTYTSGNEQNPSVSMDSTGDFVVAWTSTTEDSGTAGVYAQAYTSRGNAQGSEFLVNTYTTSSQAMPSVAMDQTGTFVVAWQSNGQDGGGYGIYGQRYSGNYTLPPTAGQVFQVNTYTSSAQVSPKTAADAAGAFVVVWESQGQDGNLYGIYAQRYNATGVAQGSAFQVNTFTTGNQEKPSVAMDYAGDFVVAWQSEAQDGSDYGVYAQRYNSSGAAQGSEFLVNTYTSGNQENPSVAMDSAGDFVVAWQSYGPVGTDAGIYAQQYNAAGTAQGSQFQVNTYTSSNQILPAVAMDSAGDFVVAWDSAGQDGPGYGVYAQRYNAAGSAQGSAFVVNSYTTGNPTTSTTAAPSVAMDAAGDFVVSWESLGQDGSDYGVYALLYNSAGTAQGSEFLVNTYTAGNQITPAAAMDSAGDFVITWDSVGQDGSLDGVFAQAYNASGTTVGSEFQVNIYTSGRSRFRPWPWTRPAISSSPGKAMASLPNATRAILPFRNPEPR